MGVTSMIEKRQLANSVSIKCLSASKGLVCADV